MRIGLKLFFTACAVLGIGVPSTEGYHVLAQCVQVGQANFQGRAPPYQTNVHYFNTSLSYPAYYTIGTYKFRTTHHFLDAAIYSAFKNDALVMYYPDKNQTCPYQLGRWGTINPQIAAEFCPKDSIVDIRTFAVKQNGVVMSGWLNFEVELMNKTDEIYAIYVQVRDEWYNAIGEFVSKDEERCHSANPDLVQPTAYQVMPCSAIGFREAKVSDALWMVNPLMLQDKAAGMPYLPLKNISRGIQFTWRLNEYWCNRHLRIRPEAIIFTKGMYDLNRFWYDNTPAHHDIPKPYRKVANYWLFPKWYGAADIKLDGTTLTCDEKVINYRQNVVHAKLEKNPDNSLVAPWFQETALQSNLDNDYVARKQWYWDDSPETVAPAPAGVGNAIHSFKSCQSNPNANRQPVFSGRCTHHYEKTPSHDALQGCNLDVNASEFADLPKNLQTYTEYVNILTINRTRQCATPCRAPENPIDLVAIQQYNSSKAPTKKPVVLKFTNIGATRNGSKVQKFWAGRKFHGQVLTFWSMFLIPVGTFASRYLKETVMSKACIGFHMWFWIHVATVLFGGGLLGCGFLALYDLINTFGRSLNEFSGMHRLLSISSIVLFSLMMAIGAYRSINMAFRKAILFLHAFLGFSVYLINLAAMVMSTQIPASPSMSGKCDPDGRPEGLSHVALVIMVWLVMDILCHVGMTALQYMVDKKIGARRSAPKYCPIIPYLPAESITDLSGKHFRKIIFLVYIVVSFIFTMTVIYMLEGGQVTEECRNKTGPSSCDDPWGCSNWAKAYSQVYSQGTTEAPKAAN